MALKTKGSREQTVWSEKDFADGRDRFWEFGKLRLWIRKTGKEWHCAPVYEDRPADPPRLGEPGEAPGDLSWNRFVTGEETVLDVVPVLPDRPVILRPEAPMKILGSSNAELFLYIPVWLKVNAVTASGRLTLTEFPSEFLSSSWFGDMKTGELCYSFRGTLYPRPLVPPEDHSHAVCPLTIRNSSQAILDFQRFCVRCVHLTLYAGDANLFTNEIRIRFSGEDQSSQVVFAAKPPEASEPLSVIAQPRVPYSSSILKKSFGFLRTLTEM